MNDAARRIKLKLDFLCTRGYGYITGRVARNTNHQRETLVGTTRTVALALVIFALTLTPLAARASTLIGEWTGTGQPVPADGTSEVLDLYFLSQTPDGSTFDLTGTVDITCLNSTDPKCGSQGIQPFTGSLAANDSVTATLSIENMTGTFNLNLSADQNALTGVLMSPSNGFEADWTLARVTPVPLPAAAWLMLSGLGGLGVLSRKRKAS